MSGITHDYMEEYIRGLIPDSQGPLKTLEEFAKENAVPIVQKETAKFLEFMVNMKKPMRILELGTAIGYSATLMYEAAGTKPHITTIERDENMIKYAKENLGKLGLQDKIIIKQGDCLEILAELEEPYDLIFMDAGKGHYNHFLPHCLRLLEKDGIIIADNVLFRGMVASKELVKRRKITIVKRMKTYLDLVSSDEDLITSVIPMGDGIAVTKRR
ncbi:O-methyltransferase [Clostridium gasigenes]|uniref:tRNA 5-hydroxyuridine methyltransferase n=1 Tax=Clostridium gasigenes TaxID=94869 RepID=A0A1H0RFQ9_9CLOT|nr:O-methyltransferase [Clostridium gasigenes]MBB6623050.1 O-methyltransferase [Clostridium gasigenes]MBB6715178.1 O-methyltransferase [Clostridium gasigenes]MBU3087820.1 O-methyltransferase [Clostridium gasigenes]MBU3107257.1 O-methyltransferase [Clostridium gasigenes]SDP27856.1 Predicted O-methyltransferase YrrM [Clostridium gasigenes]